MGRRLWSAAVGLSFAGLVACGGGDTAEDTATPMDSVPATTPAPTPAPQQPGTTALPPGVTPEMVAAGQAIFTGVGGCTACHGPDASGTPLAPNLRDTEWLNITGRNYDEIVNVIKTGVPTPKQAPAPMPARAGANLTDEQVNQVAAYVYSLGG